MFVITFLFKYLSFYYLIWTLYLKYSIYFLLRIIKTLTKSLKSRENIEICI